MKTTSILAVVIVCTGLAIAITVQGAGAKGEMVQMNSLPAEVQKTIKEKAAGGDITGVMREDDPNGKWNYEVMVKSNGKKWQFEVNPKGKFVKQH